MKSYVLMLSVILGCLASTVAQELSCDIQVSSQQIQSDKTVFVEMEKALNNLVNNTKWTNDAFEQEERIECSIFLNITKNASNTEFTGDFQITARRPVHNTSYSSTTLLYSDDNVSFSYNQFDPLQYAENTYTDELTALISFYVYMILGTDYDTFSQNGGTPYYEKALGIVNLAQQSNRTGWKSHESDENRYWFVNNYLDQFFQPLRDCLYDYHRLGFDAMQKDVEVARQKVSDAIKKVEKIHSTKPNSYNVQLFFYAKADELTKLYSEAPAQEKVEMVNLLKKLNPANAVKYNKILSSR